MIRKTANHYSVAAIAASAEAIAIKTRKNAERNGASKAERKRLQDHETEADAS